MPDAPVELSVEDYYWFYDYLGGVRDKIVQSLALPPGSRILDIGTGSGNFARAFSSGVPRSLVVGIDPVEEYLRETQVYGEYPGGGQYWLIRADLFAPPFYPETFDVAASFLGLCELLRRVPLREALQAIGKLLRPGGLLVICEGFPEKATTPERQLGFRLHEALGYRYVPLTVLEQGLAQEGFLLKSVVDFETGRPALNLSQVINFLRDECEFNRLGGGGVQNWEVVYEQFREELEQLGRVEIDAMITAVCAQKRG